MPDAFLNPADLHDPTPFGYSHTASVSAGTGLVFVAGQYASSTDGAVSSAVFSEQVKHAFLNLSVALAAHGLDLSDVVQLKTYVVDHDFGKLGTIAKAIGGHWGANPPTQTLVGVASLATPEILFEVEAIAAQK